MRSKISFFILFATVLLIPHSNPRSESFSSSSESNNLCIAPPDSGKYLLTSVTTPVEVYSFFYDDAGNIVKKIISQAFPTGTTYTYDSTENLVTEYVEEWERDEQKWIFSHKRSFTYDKNRNKLTEEWEANKSRRTFAVRLPAEGFWDINGELLGIQNQFAPVYMSLKDIYSYDTKGRLITKVSKSWGDFDMFPADDVYYTYDKKGRKLAGKNKYLEESGFKNTSRQTYTYDDIARTSIEISEFWEKGKWILSSKTTDTFDGRGNLILALNERWEKNRWVPYARTTCTFSGNGAKLSETTQFLEKNKWVNSGRQTFSYDNNGWLSGMVSEKWDEGKWNFEKQISYSYDSYGRMLSEELKSWTGGKWLLSSRNQYTFDKSGNTISGKFYTSNPHSGEYNPMMVKYNDDNDSFKLDIPDSFEAEYKFIPAKKK